MAPRRKAVQKSAPTRVLMCPPDHYEIPAIENPHMNVDQQPDKNKAARQWAVIRNSYQRLGLNVFEMDAQPRFWDMIFTANGAWGRNREMVLANFRQPIRRAESVHFKSWLERLECTVLELPPDVFFEGQGDVISLHNTFLFGAGVRSSPEAREYVRRLLSLDRPITPLDLVNPDFYHLDTCCMSLRGTDTEGLVYYPEAFSDTSQQLLKELDVEKKFEVSEALAQCFVCNSVFISNTVLLNVPFADYSDDAFELSARGELMEADEDPRFREMIQHQPDYADLITFLRELGYSILPVYTSEYLLSGAGVRCLTLFLDE